MRFYAGIDGGGTSTRAVLADQNGICRVVCSGGPSNLLAVTPEELGLLLSGLFEKLCSGAGIKPGEIAHAAVCLAGIGRKEQETTAVSVIESSVPGVPFTVTTDINAAVTGAIPDTSGVVLISGTGSIACAKDSQDVVFRSGGWGWMLGDEGSGYWIGAEILRRIFKIADGILPETGITKNVLEFLEIESVQDAVSLLYTHDKPASKIASLAPIVLNANVTGDETAVSVIQSAADSLAALTESAVKKAELTSPVTLCMFGSVVENSEFLRHAVMDRLGSGYVLRHPRLIPAAGAVLLALKADRTEISEETISNLEKIELSG